jgi:curli biogenesis system outer membrane secretion channel CsgG
VTSFAAKSSNNADVIEVQTNTIRGIDVLVNGEIVDFEMSISKRLSVRGKKHVR